MKKRTWLLAAAVAALGPTWAQANAMPRAGDDGPAAFDVDASTGGVRASTSTINVPRKFRKRPPKNASNGTRMKDTPENGVPDGEPLMAPRALEEGPPLPAQHQDRQPGIEKDMVPRPVYMWEGYKGGEKLRGQAALITGGDSGIGRATAVHFAREGADVSVVYLDEHEDARETERLIEAEGVRCLLLSGDVGSPAFCRSAMRRTMEAFGRLDVLVNNAGEQHRTAGLEEITPEQLERTFRTNVFSFFYMAQAALPALEERGGRIVNMASVTAYKGNPRLIDYSATKGAIVTFTRSLAASVKSRGIRVNSVAPGPIWTPLIPSTFPEEEVRKFGRQTPMGRAGQPAEVAACCVFLASEDSSYMTGQCLHPDGGEFTGG